MSKNDPNREYNGWKNYQTWNVALWLGNDEGLYLMAVEFMRDRAIRYTDIDGNIPADDWDKVQDGAYGDFIEYADLKGRTPDGAWWLGPHLDYEALDADLMELADLTKTDTPNWGDEEEE